MRSVSPSCPVLFARLTRDPNCLSGAGAPAREDVLGDVLPASALGTSSEDYYPTVAINALMRLLHDPSMSSHQRAITQALFDIFRTLGLSCVPYLPKACSPLLSLPLPLEQDCILCLLSDMPHCWLSCLHRSQGGAAVLGKQCLHLLHGRAAVGNAIITPAHHGTYSFAFSLR